MSIGKKLLSLRQQKGISQQELANYLHVTRQTVSKWESDLSLPDMKLSLAIAEFYNISITELLGIEEDTSQDSLKQLYERTNVVLDNMQKDFKKTRVFDLCVIGVCLLSLSISLVLLLKANNKNNQIINNNYYEIKENEDQNQSIDMMVEKYHLDTISADVSIKFSKNDISSHSQAYIYLKGSTDNDIQLPMTLNASHAFEYKGNIKLDTFKESVIVLDDDGKKSRYEFNIHEKVLSDSALLSGAITFSIPSIEGTLDRDVISYKMVKAIDGIPVRGALDKSVYIKIVSRTSGDVLLLETINAHYDQKFPLKREIEHLEELQVSLQIEKSNQGFSCHDKRIVCDYSKREDIDFYIVNFNEGKSISHYN